jgi:hypothetical protein
MPNPYELTETFETARPPLPVFCHQEFLEKLSEHARDGIGKRTTLLLQRLAVDPKRLHYKSTHGANRGWRRSRLGGGGSSHFYAWWAPKDATPLKQAAAFDQAPDGAFFLRDIRHHDDHSPLNPNSFSDHYLPLSVRDLRREEYSPAPWTPGQSRFATARQGIRILKGHPGSGKTTALWHAVDETRAANALYVTYSRDLAALARDYFDRYCSSQRSFHVVTFSSLIRQIVKAEPPAETERHFRRLFERELAAFHRRLGPWTDRKAALYDELHAHLVGPGLPAAAARFEACRTARVSDAQYLARRKDVVGSQAAAAVLETANRMERDGELAARFFPEIATAYAAAMRLVDGGAPVQLLDYDCIAVDECQDLTPLEAFVIIELASQARRRRRAPIPVLFAGDEAQTVRPTDFEWGWLNDLLHARVGAPAEFKLSVNLRSPRRIAELVNRVWDLYSHIYKRDRPSGAGAAEIDDDATDQIYYCTAVPGEELNHLLRSLVGREGLAVISLDDSVPSFVPEPLRPSVLTVPEAKGLDFHSVCVLDAGRHLERIVRYESYVRAGSDIENLEKRLAIDQLRVAFSRPTERLIWIDVNPTDPIVRHALNFLNGSSPENTISASIPAAVLKSLEEDQLDLEERIQSCQTDARQYLDVKPEIAWSRAQQAVALLGRPDIPSAITDESLRRSAHLTLAEVCFCLALRKVNLTAELGNPDLYEEAWRAATRSGRPGLGAAIQAIQKVERAYGPERLNQLVQLAQILPRAKDQLESWFLVEIEGRSAAWIDELELAMFSSHNASVLLGVLPEFYATLNIRDGGDRLARLRQRAVQLMLRDKRYGEALSALRTSTPPNPKLEATCHEGLGNYRAAAECYRAAGDLKEALRCFRMAPDFDSSLALLREMADHPAAESLEWVARLRAVVAERPEKFNRVMLPAEKKMLEHLLEEALGVARRKPSPRKTPAKRVAAKKAVAPRKRVVRKPEYF